MKKKKNVGRRLSVFTIVLALAVAIMFSVLIVNWAINSGKDTGTETLVANEPKTDKQKYEEAFYENGWDRGIIAEVKEEVPIPNGFEYVSGKKETGFIVQDKATSQKMMWIPYDETVELKNIDEYYANIKYDTIEPKAYKNMTKYGGFYVLLSDTNEYGNLKNLNQETYDEVKKKAEEVYVGNEVVNSHLLYKTEIEQVLAFANKNGINIEKTSNAEGKVSVDKLISTNTEVKKVDFENVNLSLVAVNMETGSKMGPKGGFSSNNWYVYSVPMIIKTPSGKELTVPIPVGYDAEVEDNVVTITSQGKNNLSYVWVPVNEEFNTKDFSEEGIQQLNKNLKEAYEIADRTQEEILDCAKDPTDTVEYEMLQKSIEQYGGFYMGQAELGFDNESSFNNQVRGLSYITNENGTKDTYAKNGDYYRTVSAETAKANTAQNGANYANSALEKNADGSYTLTYEKGKELTEKANEGNIVASGNLVYGAQWNAALLWIINSGNGYKLENIVQDSDSLPGAKYSKTEWERETDSIETINGLYGIAGNISDLTQEKYSESNNTNTQINPVTNVNMQAGEYNIGRGGNYGTTGEEKTASGYQIVGNDPEASDAYGIRDCLILYVHDADQLIMEHREETKVGAVKNDGIGVEKVSVESYHPEYNGTILIGNGKALLLADLVHSWATRHKMPVKKTGDTSLLFSNYVNPSVFVTRVLYEYSPIYSSQIEYAKYGYQHNNGNCFGITWQEFSDAYWSKDDNYFWSGYFYKKDKVDAPGDIVLFDNNNIEIYAGNGLWYRADEDIFLSGSSTLQWYAPTSHNRHGNTCYGVLSMLDTYMNFDEMYAQFQKYNKDGWAWSADSIGRVQYWQGNDKAVLYTMVSLAKSRDILQWRDGETWWTYINKCL